MKQGRLTWVDATEDECLTLEEILRGPQPVAAAAPLPAPEPKTPVPIVQETEVEADVEGAGRVARLISRFEVRRLRTPPAGMSLEVPRSRSVERRSAGRQGPPMVRRQYSEEDFNRIETEPE